MKKLWYMYIMKYYSAKSKNKILSFSVARMDLEGIILSEISQIDKNKYHMISFTYEI